jgi:hypothetical protein
VPGIFEEHKLNEVSLAQFDSRIYYFKKIYGTGTSLIDFGPMEVDKDKLQLFCYDLKTNCENLVNGYDIEEPNAVNTIFSKRIG